jgi:hypothetical protein
MINIYINRKNNRTFAQRSFLDQWGDELDTPEYSICLSNKQIKKIAKIFNITFGKSKRIALAHEKGHIISMQSGTFSHGIEEEKKAWEYAKNKLKSIPENLIMYCLDSHYNK